MKQTDYPIVDEIVMVQPIKITNDGVYVHLLEYNNIEGLITLSNLSRSRFRSVNKVAPLNRKFPAAVLTVDQQIGFISLSKKNVSKAEITTCESNYVTSKFIADLINVFILKLESEHNIKITSKMAYNTFIWPISNDPHQILKSLKSIGIDLNNNTTNPVWIECLTNILRSKFKEQEYLLEAVISITCYETAGIDVIKNILIQGQSLAAADYPFKINFIKSPYYSITLKTPNQEPGIKIINKTIDLIQSEADKNQANLKVIKKPEIVIDKEFEVQDLESDSESEVESEVDD